MRYIRQEIFDKIGKENQKKLKKSKITIVGIGALGTIVLDILARSGVGEITIIDGDIIELNNLQRQTLFNEKDIDKPKADVAKQKILQINSEIKIKSHSINLNHNNINLLKSDLILDCTDNIQTRFLINDYARTNNIPWIFCSVIEAKGMTMNITKKTPCFRCVFNEPSEELEKCDSSGILATTPHSLAAIQATEAIKILTNQDYSKDLIHYDLWNNKLTKVKIKNRKDCKTCNKEYSENKSKMEIKKCKTKGAFEVLPEKQLNLNKIKSKYKTISDLPILIIIEVNKTQVTCYKNGKLIIKNNNKEEAEKIAKEIYKTAK